MNCKRTIVAAAILSASMASPVLAQEVDNVNNAGAAYRSRVAPAPGGRAARLQRFYRSYNQVGPDLVAPPVTVEDYHNLQSFGPQGFGLAGRDPSRVGGYNPNLKPSGS